MKLAIADPPYLGRGVKWYGGGVGAEYKKNRGYAADNHPEAHLWDNPDTHIQLMHRLWQEYDGWAIAMARDSLATYLRAAPAPDPTIRVCVWHNPLLWPPGNRIHASWEPVLLRAPQDRMKQGSAQYTKDVLRCPTERARIPGKRTFAGAKPPAWTRWVLDMLGYDPDADTVDDLFGGSGAVTAEIHQGVLL